MAKRGSTRDKIIEAASKVFYENGFEATSVKMITQEADIVTGSFYHFFPSKEVLFETVIEEFLADYRDRVVSILEDEELDVSSIIEKFFYELKRGLTLFYESYETNKLHWTIQYSLHEKTMETMILPLTNLLNRLQKQGDISLLINLDEKRIAKLLISGSSIIVDSDNVINFEEIQELLLDYWTRFVKFDVNMK